MSGRIQILLLCVLAALACDEKDEPLSEKTRKMIAGFGMQLELPAGFEARDLDRETTRFDLAITPPSGTFELRGSFWMKGREATQVEGLLPRVVQTATLNMARDNQACEPAEAAPEVVKLFRADRVIRVCFQPRDPKYRSGLMYGLYRRGAGLVLLMVLMNEDKPADEIGPATFALRFQEQVIREF
jgi:hypothetical protein